MEIVKVSCFPNEGEPQVIQGDPVLGDIVRITTDAGAVIYERYTPPPGPIAPKPVTMTDKQFRQFVQARLGVGVYGTAFKAASESSDGAVLDAYAAWSKANTYDKSEVAAFTAALVSENILTAQQRASLVGNGNWPEA